MSEPPGPGENGSSSCYWEWLLGRAGAGGSSQTPSELLALGWEWIPRTSPHWGKAPGKHLQALPKQPHCRVCPGRRRTEGVDVLP